MDSASRDFANDTDDALDAGLRVAFGRETSPSGWGGGSALAAIERDYGLVMPASGVEGESHGPRIDASRYAIAGEIARGGIGVVLRGRDVDLGRDIAIKTLRPEHVANPVMVRRLVEEARIGGQLQHPGVLPVYEMGLDPERRPYFTMKLVQGQTFADLLHGRTDLAQERRRFVAIFEQICQTVAYAHARGIAHRDLKPANIMVGAFGEVQVVDWGLAKVLGSAGDGDGSPVASQGSDSAAQSEPGSVLGTPAYMPPEQARGTLGELDARCDVFSLGAILCEILTGQPPYDGDRAERLAQAREGRLAPAHWRLDSCGADEALVQLARECLAADRDARPRDAGAVAARVTVHLASVDERARRAALDAAVARARADSERRARRAVTLAAVVTLFVLLLGGGAYLRVERQRARVAQDAARVERQRLAVEGQRLKVEGERLALEAQRLTRLENALTLVRSLRAKGEWILLRARDASVHDARGWADALGLTRQAVERTLPFEAADATRKQALALIDDLRAAEATLRERAASTSARPRGTPEP